MCVVKLNLDENNLVCADCQSLAWTVLLTFEEKSGLWLCENCEQARQIKQETVLPSSETV